MGRFAGGLRCVPSIGSHKEGPLFSGIVRIDVCNREVSPWVAFKLGYTRPMEADRHDPDRQPIPSDPPDSTSPDPSSPDPAPPAEGQPDGGGDLLGRTLRGTLPCIGCCYELQGLSVRSPCPECGILVRATILHSVDPHADEFQPLSTPALTAWGLAMWPSMGLLAVLLAWIPRVIDFSNEIFGVHWMKPDWLPLVMLLAVFASGLGAVALVRPSAACPPKNTMAAALGVAAYVPIAWLLIAIVRFPVSTPYINTQPDFDRITLRLALSGALLVMLLCLRPNARRLVARCLALRTGRVQRQTILASAAAVGLTAIGDLLLLASIAASSETLVLIGKLVVLMGSILMTAALLGATVDSWRIRGAILAPAPSMGRLFDHQDDHGHLPG